MDLVRVEKELKERLIVPYSWGRKQSNDWDKNTNFIYNTYSYSKLLERTKNCDPEVKDYALNRWYNYWSAMAAEDIFTTHKNVLSNKNIYDKLVDFKINNIPFDHKTSVFPKGFNKTIEYAQKNKWELIEWLYKNQSQQGRQHFKNRLFIILYDIQNQQHWKMKAEIQIIKSAIDTYVENFSQNHLSIHYFDQEKIFSDIIWVIK